MALARMMEDPVIQAMKYENGVHIPAGRHARLRFSLQVLLRVKVNLAAKGKGRVSSKTRSERYKFYRSLIEDLYMTLGYKIEDIFDLKTKHINAITQFWVEQGLAPKTIQTYFSMLRTLCEWIGKPGIILEPDKYFTDEQYKVKTGQVSKSWTDQGVDPVAKISEVAKIDPWVCIQLLLQLVFGLRRQESMKLRPHIADQGVTLYVAWGTKGGRERFIPIKNEEQRFVLDLAKQYTSGSKSMIPGAYSYKQWDRHYRYQIEKVGITRANGITSHGLRHEFANATYEQIMQVAAPLRRDPEQDYEVDKERDRMARLTVSCQLGHARASITNAYLGPKNKKPKKS